MPGDHGHGISPGLPVAEEAEDGEERHDEDEHDEEVITDAHLVVQRRRPTLQGELQRPQDHRQDQHHLCKEAEVTSVSSRLLSASAELALLSF